MSDLLDVIAVNLETNAVRVMARDKNERNAEAIVDMAALRRGVEEEYFTTAPAGLYKDGDPLAEEAEGEAEDQ